MIERVTGRQHEANDGFLHPKAPQFGEDRRKDRFARTCANDNHQFGREIANESQHVYASSPGDRGQHDSNKKRAAKIELADQLAQGQER